MSESTPVKLPTVFENPTGFLIYNLFCIFPELSLKQMSDLLGKSKSTIHNHIKILVKAGLVRMIREDKVSSDKDRHIYALDEKAKELTHYLQIDKDLPLIEQNFQRINMMKSFSETKIRFFKLWIEYLDYLENQIHAGSNEEVTEILKSILCNHHWTSQISFYTPSLIQEMLPEYRDFYEKYDAKDQQEQPDMPGNIRSLFFGMDILPVQRILEELPHIHAQKKKNNKGSPKQTHEKEGG